MALKKTIRQLDGVTTNYHRILFVMATINSHNSIAVLSYVDEEARNEEINNLILTPYKHSTTYETDYKENMTIKDAYDYLKTLPEFEGAEDDFEEHPVIVESEEETTEVEDTEVEESTEEINEEVKEEEN